MVPISINLPTMVYSDFIKKIDLHSICFGAIGGLAVKDLGWEIRDLIEEY